MSFSWQDAAGLGLGGGLMSGMFNQPNPADSAMPYLNQLAGTISPYFNPYIQAGNQALPQMQNQYGNLLNDPGGMLNKMGAGYQQSPGYQFALSQALQGANQASAAGGMSGTPQSQQQSAGIATNMANQDYYNYLNKVLGLYGSGLQGIAGLGQLGYGAASNLGEDLASGLQSQANLAYSGQANKNQAQGGMMGAGLGLIGSALGFL